MLSPEQKAEDIVGEIRMVLMNEDTECGNEILCTSIAKKIGLIMVKNIKESRKEDNRFDDSLVQSSSVYSNLHPMGLTYWNDVEKYIKKI